jgi:hypothetical protein
MTQTEALRLALEAMEKSEPNKRMKAITAIKAALEAKDEPVAWVYPEFWQHLENLNCGTAYRLTGIGRQPLYTTQPQRTWVGLTDEEIAEALGDEIDSVYMTDFRRVEAKLKEKNT